MLFLWVISLSYTTLTLYLIHDRQQVCHVTQGMDDSFHLTEFFLSTKATLILH
jgi:hypothetical protein